MCVCGLLHAMAKLSRNAAERRSGTFLKAGIWHSGTSMRANGGTQRVKMASILVQRSTRRQLLSNYRNLFSPRQLSLEAQSVSQ